MNEIKSPRKQQITYFLLVAVVMILLNSMVMPYLQNAQITETDYNTFINMTENGQVKEVEISSSQILFTDTEDKVYATAPVSDPDLVSRLHDHGVKFGSQIIRPMSPLLSFLLSWILPIGIFAGLYYFLNKKMMEAGGRNSMMFGMGKSNAKVYVQSTEGIRFSDVAGEEEAKEALQEVVDYLHNPGKYKEIGAAMPKGILLVGPPGTGKTMLAKAVAGESNVPFFSMSGSEFVEMFVGMGASKVRDLFKQAKEKAPCIVFIDEIDAIGKRRDGTLVGGNDEREQTLNQLLTEMDGFEENTGVVILAATNRPDALDPALTRPGRFDRRVPVELPDLKGREDILKVHAKKIKCSSDVDFNKIARMAAGASGAELANIVNEAALRAVRDGRKFATQADFEESIEVVIAGYQKKNAILTDKEKLIVSYHEIGHALVAAMQKHSAPVSKITIIPRTSGALGYTMQVEEEGNHEQDGAREQDRDALRRPRGGGDRVRQHHDGRLQRHRAGHEARALDDHALRHERRVRHGGHGDADQPVPGRRHFPRLLRGDAGPHRQEGRRARARAAPEGAQDPHGQQAQDGRAGGVPVLPRDHHRRGIHADPVEAAHPEGDPHEQRAAC